MTGIRVQVMMVMMKTVSDIKVCSVTYVLHIYCTSFIGVKKIIQQWWWIWKNISQGPARLVNLHHCGATLYVSICLSLIFWDSWTPTNKQTPSFKIDFFSRLLSLILQSWTGIIDMLSCAVVSISMWRHTTLSLSYRNHSAAGRTQPPHAGLSSPLKGIRMKFAPVNLWNHWDCNPSSLHDNKVFIDWWNAVLCFGPSSEARISNSC